MGQIVEVRLVNIDSQGRLNFTMLEGDDDGTGYGQETAATETAAEAETTAIEEEDKILLI